MGHDRRFWVMLPPSRSATKTVAVATEAERRGLEGVFSIQLGSNPWVPLGAVAATTSRIRLASGIALAFARPPLETALAALDLDHLSDGRFTLGLGTGVRWVHDDQFGMPYSHPAARMAETVRIIKAIISGDARRVGRMGGDHGPELDFSRLDIARPLRPDLPVWVAALRSPLVTVAGETADGLIGHPSWSARWAIEQVNGPYRDAVHRSGRQRGDVEVNLWHVAAPHEDAAQSVRDAKTHVALYGSIAQYESYFAAHGFGEDARRLQAAAATRDPAIVDLVPDEMARTFVLCGTPADVARQLEPLIDAADSLCLQPPPVRGEQRRDYEARIAELIDG